MNVMCRKTVWVVAVVVVGVVVGWFVVRGSVEDRIERQRDQLIEALRETAPLVAVEGEPLGEGRGEMFLEGTPPLNEINHSVLTSYSVEVLSHAERIDRAVPLLQDAGWDLQIRNEETDFAQLRHRDLLLTLRPNRDGDHTVLKIMDLDAISVSRDTRLDKETFTFDLGGAD